MVKAAGQTADGYVVQSVGFRVSASGVWEVVDETPPAGGEPDLPGGVDDETLPRTGADGTATLARVGAALVALGGCPVLATRHGRHRVGP